MRYSLRSEYIADIEEMISKLKDEGETKHRSNRWKPVFDSALWEEVCYLRGCSPKSEPIPTANNMYRDLLDGFRLYTRIWRDFEVLGEFQRELYSPPIEKVLQKSYRTYSTGINESYRRINESRAPASFSELVSVVLYEEQQLAGGCAKHVAALTKIASDHARALGMNAGDPLTLRKGAAALPQVQLVTYIMGFVRNHWLGVVTRVIEGLNADECPEVIREDLGKPNEFFLSVLTLRKFIEEEHTPYDCRDLDPADYGYPMDVKSRFLEGLIAKLSREWRGEDGVGGPLPVSGNRVTRGPDYSGTHILQQETKTDLVNLLSDLARHTPTRYFEMLIDSANIPDAMKKDLADKMNGTAMENAWALVNQAQILGVDPDMPSNTILGLLLMTRLPMTDDSNDFLIGLNHVVFLATVLLEEKLVGGDDVRSKLEKRLESWKQKLEGHFGG